MPTFLLLLLVWLVQWCCVSCICCLCSSFFSSLELYLFSTCWVPILRQAFETSPDFPVVLIYKGWWRHSWMCLRRRVILLYIHKSKDLLGRTPWDTGVEKTRVQQNWLIFRNDVLDQNSRMAHPYKNVTRKSQQPESCMNEWGTPVFGNRGVIFSF